MSQALAEDRVMSTLPRPARVGATTDTQSGRLTLFTDNFQLVVPPQIRNLDEFRAWATADDFPERIRVTYLEGEVYLDMSNEEINTAGARAR
jgi:hypothetical protein